jgi:hypothetical protein
MTAWVAEIIFYAALAVGVTWVSWRHPVAVIGLTLVLCAVVTNVAYFRSSFASRVTLEVVQAVVIGNSARIAFKASPGWPSAIITGLAAIDTAFCFTVALADIAPDWRGVIFGWGTNALFFIQCLCVGTPGVRDALVGRRSHVAGGRDLDHAHILGDGRQGKD